MPTIDELKKRKSELEKDIACIKNIINKKIEAEDYDVDNMFGQITALEKLLASINYQINCVEPVYGDEGNEIERKAIGIAASGRGIDIRAKNDDSTKYVAKKRKSFAQIEAEAKSNAQNQLAHNKN